MVPVVDLLLCSLASSHYFLVIANIVSCYRRRQLICVNPPRLLSIVCPPISITVTVVHVIVSSFTVRFQSPRHRPFCRPLLQDPRLPLDEWPTSCPEPPLLAQEMSEAYHVRMPSYYALRRSRTRDTLTVTWSCCQKSSSSHCELWLWPLCRSLFPALHYLINAHPGVHSCSHSSSHRHFDYSFYTKQTNYLFYNTLSKHAERQ